MGTKRKKPNKGSSSSGAAGERKTIALNKKARHDYEIVDVIEAGLVLMGTEVKVLREGRISLAESYGRITDDEVFLVGAHIDPYSHSSLGNHLPTRPRKLLMRRMEIRKLKAKVTQKGLTLVPLEIYFNEQGLAKLSLAVCRGKRHADKRESLKKADASREMRRQ